MIKKKFYEKEEMLSLVFTWENPAKFPFLLLLRLCSHYSYQNLKCVFLPFEIRSTSVGCHISQRGLWGSQDRLRCRVEVSFVLIKKKILSQKTEWIECQDKYHFQFSTTFIPNSVTFFPWNWKDSKVIFLFLNASWTSISDRSQVEGKVNQQIENRKTSCACFSFDSSDFALLAARLFACCYCMPSHGTEEEEEGEEVD